MALSQDEMKQMYPLPAYNYRVEIDGVAVGFSKASGLDVSYETTTYKQSPTESGQVGPVVMHMPGQRSNATVTLERGLCASPAGVDLYEWIGKTQGNRTEKRDIHVRLLDENGEAVVSWRVVNAFPTKLTGPSFSADGNELAIESMELMADSVLIERV